MQRDDSLSQPGHPFLKNLLADERIYPFPAIIFSGRRPD